MPKPTEQEVLSDPDFKGLPPAEQAKVIAHIRGSASSTTTAPARTDRSSVAQFGVGAGKGALSTATGAGSILDKITGILAPGGVGMVEGMAPGALAAGQAASQPTTPVEKAGYGIEHAAEYLVPSSAGVKGTGLLGRMIANAAGAAGVRGVQTGGDLAESGGAGVLAGGLTGIGGGLAKAAGALPKGADVLPAWVLQHMLGAPGKAVGLVAQLARRMGGGAGPVAQAAEEALPTALPAGASGSASIEGVRSANAMVQEVAQAAEKHAASLAKKVAEAKSKGAVPGHGFLPKDLEQQHYSAQQLLAMLRGQGGGG